MLAKPKLIILDWDGTLADTHTLIRQGLDYTCEKFNRALFTEDEFNIAISGSAHQTFAGFFGKGNQQKAYEIYSDYVGSHPELVIPINGSIEFLTTAQKKNIPLLVISFKRQDFLNKEIDQFGWRHYFSSIRGRNHLDPAYPVKPDPIVYHESVKAMAQDIPHIKDTWVIGDGANDIRLANNLGAVAIAFGEKPVIDNQKIHFHAKTFSDLIPYL